MARQKLAVEKRTVFGKKLKKLRKEGILPANIYGKDIKSISVQVPYKDFEKVYKEARETGLIDVQVANGEVKPSLIHNVQRDSYKDITLHADFFQVNLKEKVKTMVPVVTVGIAQAVSDKLGLLLQPISQVEIEALPEDLPEKIEINVEHLGAVNDQILVSEIKAPKGVTVLTDSSQVAVKIGELVSKEAQAQLAAEQAAKEAAKAESDSAKAAAAPTEGVAQPSEGAKLETQTGAKPEAKSAEQGKPSAQSAKETPKT